MSNETQNNKQFLTLPVSILIGAVLVAGAVIYAVGIKNQPAGQTAQVGAGNQPAALEQLMELNERDVVLGDPNAPVTLIEYGDYQCPFCYRFFSLVEPVIRENYIQEGKVRMVYRDLAFLGAESLAAAEAAACAKDQGKFWEFHDALYEAEGLDGAENNGNLNRQLFLQIAGRGGLDAQEFTTCFDGGEYKQEVLQTTSRAQNAGIRGTPTVLINGALLSGVDPRDPAGQYLNAIRTLLGEQ